MKIEEGRCECAYLWFILENDLYFRCYADVQRVLKEGFNTKVRVIYFLEFFF